MNLYIISEWLVLLATTACLQNVNCENVTPLISAVLNNNVDLVKRLLANGADAKATYYGKSALMMAAEYGDNKMVEILLPKSDAKATDTSGDTALMWAVLYGTAQMVEILLPESDVKAANTKGDTALDLAKALGSNQIVRLLQQYN